MSALRTGLSEEDGYRDLVHVTAEDVTETRTPTPEQARAIGLLELNPAGLPVPRLSLFQWQHVDRVVVALGSLGVPAPRQAADDMETRAVLAPLSGQHTPDEEGAAQARIDDSDTADELAAAGLRACCGQPSERHCQ